MALPRGFGAFVSCAFVTLTIGLTATSCSSNEREERVGQQAEELVSDGGPLTKQLLPVADTFVRELTPNQNQGTQPTLRLAPLGASRALVRFDATATSQLAGPVTLRLTIASSSGCQGTHTIAVHRLTHDFTELGATWNCSTDANLSNFRADCSGPTAWEMGRPFRPDLHPWVATPSATATVVNGQTGTISFDVSADVALFRSGAVPNYGFLIKRVDELSPGLVELGSRESAHPPLLVGQCVDVDGGGACEAVDGGADGAAFDGSASDGAASDASPSIDASTPDASGTDSGPACTPALCDDGQACTLDTCGPTGCTHVPVVDGAACGGSFCGGRAACAAGACVVGPPPTDPGPGPCTFSVCDDATGTFTHPPKPAGTTCDDGTLLCRGRALCNGAGTCQPGLPVQTDDGDVCTVDACAEPIGVTHTRIPGCDSTPVSSDAPLETRASITGRLVTSAGAAISGATFTVFDERASGAPRSDVAATTASNGGFKLRFTTFPESEPVRSPPHRFVVWIDSPSTLRAFRVAYAHPGESIDLGSIRLVGRDPKITNIGPAGGTATDSQGRVEIVIPPGALASTIPVQITPLLERADFPAALPSSTLTMYGFAAEPSGTAFAVPVTVRAANYRNLPTTLKVPIGAYDEIEGRWEHEGTAAWDGARFSGTITHFSTHDLNNSNERDRILLISRTGGPNQSEPKCGTGSAWSIGGGSVTQGFPLPGTTSRGDELGLSLHYDSGLAGNRRMDPAGSPVSPQQTGPGRASSLGVSMPGVTVQSFCVSPGTKGPSATKPGQCVVAAGSCGNGGATMAANLSMLGSQIDTVRETTANSTDASFGGWLELPYGESGELPPTAFASQTFTLRNLNAAGGGGCAGDGDNKGTFGVSDPLAPRTQTSAEEGPAFQATRKVLVHHRFTSPYGAGWAIREVSRAYVAGDFAVLVGGDGQEEEFRPRARVSALPDGQGEQVFARDDVTGEVFAASYPGLISRIDPVTGVRTPVLSGLAFPAEYHHAFAIAYVGSVRHFVVAFTSQLLDFDAAGTRRLLTTRGPVATEGRLVDAAFGHSSVAARGSALFYTDGDLLIPLLYRFDLATPSPAKEVLSTLDGDVRLDPRAPLSGVQFGHPLGLAFGPDGVLYIADPRRNVVYQVTPGPSGAISATSAVSLAFGDGAGHQVLRPGEAQPARELSINQPLRLGMAEDGKLLVLTMYGVFSFDTLAREGEVLFLHGANDEIQPNLAGGSGTSGATPASFVALTSTSILSRSYNDGAVRVDVDLLSSETDPTRTLRALPGGGRELLDTSRAMTWRFDAAGRLVEQKKRTGETDFTVAYTTATGDAIDHISNAVGGQWAFGYASGKLASITDPAGGRTQMTVNAQGDLLDFTEPDGESHTFTYDAHHMASKTTSRGDRTAYTFKPDGTVATSTKPGGESYAFDTVPVVSAVYGADGKTLRSGAYTDARGVVHSLELNRFGQLDRETYVADGVARVVEAVRPSALLGPGESGVATRKNAFLRTSQRTMNGIALAPPVQFDSLGRPVSQRRAVGELLGSWTYAADGWLTESLSGPAVVSQHYERDAAGHVTRIFDGSIGLGGAPTGRETTFTWRADGQPATMTMHGVTTTFGYDDVGGTKNLLSAVDTLGRTLTLGYDVRGNVVSTSDGTASASAVFDANNRLVESRDALGNATTLRYTHAGCGCSESDLVTGVHTPDLPAGIEWTLGYGAQGRLASVTDPHGFTESYTYEPTGEVASIKDRLARTTTMAHDQLGRLLSMVDTLGRRHDRSYTVPTGGVWSGPSLTAASANGTASTTSLSGALRSGDYQLGVNAHDTEGFPAQITLYRDATFALGYTSYFDDGKRVTYRADRTSRPLDFTSIPPSQEPGPFSQERAVYDSRTSAALPTTVEAQRSTDTEASVFTRNVEYDLETGKGSGGGLDKAAEYGYARDGAGRLTQLTTRFASPAGLAEAPAATYVYRPDGRVGRVTNADGVHDFTYDARGLLATQTIADEGVYAYGYDALGRSTTITYPDGHVRHQVFDDLGRVTSRCYEYPGDASLNRCYGAQYDAVGNPLRLMSPEGDDVMEYDALDRLTKVTREVAGGPSAIETYDFNALGALKTNAGVALDHQRPRLDGAGSADAAVPATLGGSPVTLDLGGRVTSLRGVTLTWSQRSYLAEASPPIPAVAEQYGVDAFLRRVWKVQGGSAEYYAYQGADRIAIVGPNGVDPGTGFSVPGPVLESYLFAGIDHPLRLKRAPGTTVYFELDLAGNVRGLRGPGGTDLGGYRYTAFGAAVVTDAVAEQPLRWKARWYSPIAGGIYDVRARQWSPDLGSFLSVDEFEFHDGGSTLWGWPAQNPTAFSDPTGRDGTTDNPIQDLLNANLLPPGLTIFGKGVRERSAGIAMLANDATVEQGLARMNCGNAIIAAGAGIVGTDATVLVGLAQFAAGAAGGGGGGGMGGGGGRGNSRPLTAADLGLKDDAIVQGTFSVRGDKATAYVQYLGAPEGGLGSGLAGSRGALSEVARSEGATVLRIETSPIIEITGRLERALGRAGFEGRGNGTMWWEGLL